jgi:hypothetical protein
MLKHASQSVVSPIGATPIARELSSDGKLEELLDQLCSNRVVEELAKRYPFCRITLQIQNGEVVHTDLNLSYKPNQK